MKHKSLGNILKFQFRSLIQFKISVAQNFGTQASFFLFFSFFIHIQNQSSQRKVVHIS